MDSGVTNRPLPQAIRESAIIILTFTREVPGSNLGPSIG